jgi:pSer/pThr/pTyr-binding forkhead associated (FHA) protein
MSTLTLLLLQLGFLVLLWVMVLSVVGVMRRDLFGTRVVARQPARSKTPPGGTPAPRPARQARAEQRPAPARTAPTRLVVVEGPLRGTTLNLAQAPVLIGRSPECTLVLSDDFASSRHARLTPTEGGWTVEDLGSTNGTQLDGAPLGGPRPAQAGSLLKIGRTVIELRR